MLSHDRVMLLAWSLYVYAKISRVITFPDDTICVGGNQTFKNIQYNTQALDLI